MQPAIVLDAVEFALGGHGEVGGLLRKVGFASADHFARPDLPAEPGRVGRNSPICRAGSNASGRRQKSSGLHGPEQACNYLRC